MIVVPSKKEIKNMFTPHKQNAHYAVNARSFVKNNILKSLVLKHENL